LWTEDEQESLECGHLGGTAWTAGVGEAHVSVCEVSVYRPSYSRARCVCNGDHSRTVEAPGDGTNSTMERRRVLPLHDHSLAPVQRGNARLFSAPTSVILC
jgi:hypothetical protein